jgi:hypothetical protein
MKVYETGEDTHPYTIKENQITRLVPNIEDEIFSEKVKKEPHKNRKRIVQSKQYPEIMFYTDPETNCLFLLRREGLGQKGKQNLQK